MTPEDQAAFRYLILRWNMIVGKMESMEIAEDHPELPFINGKEGVRRRWNSGGGVNGRYVGSEGIDRRGVP